MPERIRPDAFDEDEIDAIILGLCLAVASGEDEDTVTAALRKIESALPSPSILVSAERLGGDPVGLITAAMACERKLALDYIDRRERSSERVADHEGRHPWRVRGGRRLVRVAAQLPAVSFGSDPCGSGARSTVSDPAAVAAGAMAGRGRSRARLGTP